MKRLESLSPPDDPRNVADWYHGSPADLTELAAGSTISPDRALAEAFSHKPAILCIDDDGVITHDGRWPGRLYRVSEPLAPGDVEIHPRTAMTPGLEWIVGRNVAVRFVASVPVDGSEMLSPETLRRIRECGR